MKIFIKCLLLFSIAFAYTSCDVDEEICYSCNQSVNNWAQENKSEILKMNREDIIKLSGEKQRAAFRVLTPSKRKSVWRDKLNHLKQKHKKKEELELIAYVESLVNELSFKRELTDKEYYVIEENLLPLVERAGWSKSEMVYAFGTLQNTKSKEDNDFFNKTDGGSIGGGGSGPGDEPDCNCKWGWCGSGDDCEKDSCDETNLGCGALGLGSCTKICGGNPN
ncbi:bacteriocin fulvocin C-related protein [Bizionia myxarmorum]|uniref:Bacteriocin fulvocin C-related protein n=1 Tax=Bizionia myxarmorum TaxID=291186 RepID=A0A5D0QUW0_9FLAO|nr:bacteriocin fulvocin C-related protein [Bizionia myxarmorum]TYB73003.1 bacteriocin fulvocin C-related protein [Bizionia myxarmorum]